MSLGNRLILGLALAQRQLVGDTIDTGDHHFAFIPEISRDLQNWFQATLPTPFLVLTETTSAGDRIYTAEPSADWPPPFDKVFMRVNIESK